MSEEIKQKVEKVRKEKEHAQPTASAILADGSLAEMVYRPEENRTTFLRNKRRESSLRTESPRRRPALSAVLAGKQPAAQRGCALSLGSRRVRIRANWSHDGKYVYFDSTAKGEPAFYRVQIKDHRVERVASLKDVKRPTSGSWGAWTGLAPDDSPLALRDISTFDIYALEWQLP